AKTKVASVKPWTIPKLELGAAWLLSKFSTVEAFKNFVDLSEPICFVERNETEQAR
ncbi:hypothetical protein HHI36_002704, partial [Cryptolaemus montrouzieri]